MRLKISPSKNAKSFYVIRSIRREGKNSSEIVEKLGTEKYIKETYGVDDAEAWARAYIEKLNQDEANKNHKVLIPFATDTRIPVGKQFSFNAGYLFLQKIYYQLGLPSICRKVTKNHSFDYDLNSILSRLVYGRILYPSSKLSCMEQSKSLIEQPNFELHHIYRALSVLAEDSDYVQAQLYKNSKKVLKRSTGVLYYDCTNYFFEIEEARGSAQYGKCKEHRPNPIVQMGLFLDGDGFPLCFSMFPGNHSEQPSLKPLEKKILKDFKLSEFIVCTDAGLASTENRKFNNINGRSFIVTQSLKKLKKFLREWALDPQGWHLDGSNQVYNIHEIDEQVHRNSIFYKERWIHESGLEQRLIVSYSIKDRDYQRHIREKQIHRAEKMVSEGLSASTRNQNSPKRFVSETSVTSDGEVAEKKVLSLDTDQIEKEAMYDGFYAVCTTLEKDIKEIIHINKMRWQIEAAFRTMKSEFKARPVYLRNDDRINAHFLTCFLSLLILRMIEKKIGNEYSEEQILNTLRSMRISRISDLGYFNHYTRTRITDALHDAFGFRTDSEFISDKTMKKIFKLVEKG